MNEFGPWSTTDYDSMSWHDVHVHGFPFDNFKPDDGTADLILDIDYILKWEKSKSQFIFTVCRADLRFNEVFGLKMSIDYSTPTAGMYPFSINGIERELLESRTGHASYQWLISVNWPLGQLEFKAPSFLQKLTGTPCKQSQQALMGEDRNDENAT